MKGKASEKDKDVSENFQDMRVKQRQQENRICPDMMFSLGEAVSWCGP